MLLTFFSAKMPEFFAYITFENLLSLELTMLLVLEPGPELQIRRVNTNDLNFLFFYFFPCVSKNILSRQF